VLTLNKEKIIEKLTKKKKDLEIKIMKKGNTFQQKQLLLMIYHFEIILPLQLDVMSWINLKRLKTLIQHLNPIIKILVVVFRHHLVSFFIF